MAYHIETISNWVIGTSKRLRSASSVGRDVVEQAQTERLLEGDVLSLKLFLPCRLKFGHKHKNRLKMKTTGQHQDNIKAFFKQTTTTTGQLLLTVPDETSSSVVKTSHETTGRQRVQQLDLGMFEDRWS